MPSRDEILGQLTNDLLAFLDKEDGMHRQARLEALREIFNKHALPNIGDLSVTKKDFTNIVSSAKTSYATSSPATSYGRPQLTNDDEAKICLLNAFVGFLNSKNALCRAIQFEEKKNG